jgi:hypothetical protein
MRKAVTGRCWWREAFQAYRAAEENGWSGGTNPLYASALRAGDRLAYAIPGDLQTLKFHFEPGKTVYAQLIAETGFACGLYD